VKKIWSTSICCSRRAVALTDCLWSYGAFLL
jgi:hypothetical protein